MLNKSPRKSGGMTRQYRRGAGGAADQLTADKEVSAGGVDSGGSAGAGSPQCRNHAPESVVLPTMKSCQCPPVTTGTASSTIPDEPHSRRHRSVKSSSARVRTTIRTGVETEGLPCAEAARVSPVVQNSSQTTLIMSQKRSVAGKQLTSTSGIRRPFHRQ